MKKIFLSFVMCVIALTSVSAQAPRQSKGDIYTNEVVPAYNYLVAIANDYVRYANDPSTNADMFIGFYIVLSAAECRYHYAVQSYYAAPTREELIAEESRNGSNYQHTDGAYGSYAAQRVGEDAHNARMAMAYNSLPTPSNTRCLTFPQINGLAVVTDDNGVRHYYYPTYRTNYAYRMELDKYILG